MPEGDVGTALRCIGLFQSLDQNHYVTRVTGWCIGVIRLQGIIVWFRRPSQATLGIPNVTLSKAVYAWCVKPALRHLLFIDKCIFFFKGKKISTVLEVYN